MKQRHEMAKIAAWTYLAAAAAWAIGALADLPIFALAGFVLCLTHGALMTSRAMAAQRLHDYLAAMACDANLADPALISDQDLNHLNMLCKACPPGPWDIDETSDTWILHSAPVGEGLPTLQILKAPKRGTPYAEYWPDPPTAELIRASRTVIPTLIAEIRRERSAMARALAGYPQLPEPKAGRR